MKNKHITLWIFGSIALMAIGAIGLWAKATDGVTEVTLNGYDRDGAILLVLGAIAVVIAVLMARSSKRPRPRWTYVVGAIIGVLCAAIAFYDWGTLDEDAILGVSISVGWGLVLATIASVSLTVAFIAGMAIRGKEAPVPVAAPESAE
jgi:RsiW-degrading membrane proteinase PrsW (M82 family)